MEYIKRFANWFSNDPWFAIWIIISVLAALYAVITLSISTFGP